MVIRPKTWKTCKLQLQSNKYKLLTLKCTRQILIKTVLIKIWVNLDNNFRLIFTSQFNFESFSLCFFFISLFLIRLCVTQPAHAIQLRKCVVTFMATSTTQKQWTEDYGYLYPVIINWLGMKKGNQESQENRRIKNIKTFNSTLDTML